MSDVGWRFPPSNDGVREGFNAPAVDIFKNQRLQGLVRETIQNSLDAKTESAGPVIVHFTLDELSDTQLGGLDELAGFFAAALEVEQNANGRDFYKAASDRVSSGVVRVLGVHDYNTTGLTGPTENLPSNPKNGAWLALVKGSGVTHKTSTSALGSFGHGSRAPFAMSELRTIYYFTRVKVADGNAETRFQGKSILQSVPLLEVAGVDDWSVATGFFGRRAQNRCEPLIDDDIPSFFKERRPEPQDSSPSIGTSIYILEPFGLTNQHRLWNEVKLAVVTNFYYAVATKKLIVRIGGDMQIDSSNIHKVFDEISETKTLDEIGPADITLDRLESARTIRYSNMEDSMDIEGFGRVAWHLRFDDVSGRRVGIARGNGMLITRSPEKLKRFSGTKPFDLFLCVEGVEGSEALRMLENPEHTDFSFDRISDKQTLSKVRKAYTEFAKSVRALLAKHTSVETIEEVAVSDLDDLIREDPGPGEHSIEGEPIRSLRIAAVNKRTNRMNRPSEVAGDDIEASGRGASGGDGSHTTNGGTIPGDGSGSASTGFKRGTPVKNLRIVRQPNREGAATVYFTLEGTPTGKLELRRSGETQSEPLVFRTDPRAPWIESLEISNLSNGARKRLDLFFRSEDLTFAIEGRIIA